MLGRNYNFIVKYNEKEMNLEFTLRTLKNIFDLVGYSPFEYLTEFLTLEENKEIYLAQILYCITDGGLDIVDVLENLLVDEATINGLYDGVIGLVNLELKSEVIEDDEDQNEEDKKELTRADKIVNFIQWWNSIYYTSKVNLNLSYDEMLNSTVREIKTLDTLHRNYYRNILLDAYIKVTKSSNEVSKENDKVIKNVRLKDFLTAI